MLHLLSHRCPACGGPHTDAAKPSLAQQLRPYFGTFIPTPGSVLYAQVTLSGSASVGTTITAATSQVSNTIGAVVGASSITLESVGSYVVVGYASTGTSTFHDGWSFTLTALKNGSSIGTATGSLPNQNGGADTPPIVVTEVCIPTDQLTFTISNNETFSGFPLTLGGTVWVFFTPTIAHPHL